MNTNNSGRQQITAEGTKCDSTTTAVVICEVASSTAQEVDKHEIRSSVDVEAVTTPTSPAHAPVHHNSSAEVDEAMSNNCNNVNTESNSNILVYDEDEDATTTTDSHNNNNISDNHNIGIYEDDVISIDTEDHDYNDNTHEGHIVIDIPSGSESRERQQQQLQYEQVHYEQSVHAVVAKCNKKNRSRTHIMKLLKMRRAWMKRRKRRSRNLTGSAAPINDGIIIGYNDGDEEDDDENEDEFRYTWGDLPLDLWVNIFEFAAGSSKDLCAFSEVSVSLYEASRSNVLWKPLLLKLRDQFILREFKPAAAEQQQQEEEEEEGATENGTNAHRRSIELLETRHTDAEDDAKKSDAEDALTLHQLQVVGTLSYKDEYIALRKEIFKEERRIKFGATKSERNRKRFQRHVNENKKFYNWVLGSVGFVGIFIFTFMLMLKVGGVLALPNIMIFIPLLLGLCSLAGIFIFMFIVDYLNKQVTYRVFVVLLFMLLLMTFTVLIDLKLDSMLFNTRLISRITGKPNDAHYDTDARDFFTHVSWFVVFIPVFIILVGTLLFFNLYEFYLRDVFAAKRCVRYRFKPTHLLPPVVLLPILTSFILLALYLHLQDTSTGTGGVTMPLYAVFVPLWMSELVYTMVAVIALAVVCVIKRTRQVFPLSCGVTDLWRTIANISMVIMFLISMMVFHVLTALFFDDALLAKITGDEGGESGGGGSNESYVSVSPSIKIQTRGLALVPLLLGELFLFIEFVLFFKE